MPSRKHLRTKLIPARHSEIFSEIVRLMQLAPQLCVTLDIWTNRQMRSYIGMTGHFIVDFKLKSVMLACNRFRGSHTGEEILLHFKRIESDFEINGKVDNIVTDNGSNMLKAFRLLSLKNEDDHGDETDDDIIEAVDVDSELQAESGTVKPKHYPCFSHTVQLVVKDGMAHADQVKRILKKCQD